MMYIMYSGCFEAWVILFTPHCSSSVSCVNDYLGIDSGGYEESSRSCINENLATDSGGYVNE